MAANRFHREVMMEKKTERFPGARLMAAVVLLGYGLVQAGAWNRKPGAGVVTGSISFLTASEVSDAKGNRRDYAIKELAVAAYGEYGVFQSLAFGAAISPHKFVYSDSGDAQGVSDLELWGDRHLLTRGNLQVAMRLLAVFPVGLENRAWTPDWLYALHSQGALGIEAMPLLGWSRQGLWMQGGLGGRLRGNGLVGQFRYQYSVGTSVGPGKWLGLRLGLSGVVPLESESNGKPSDQEMYFGQQLAAEAKLPQRLRLGLQFDSMISAGQELPLGLRSNLFLGWAW